MNGSAILNNEYTLNKSYNDKYILPSKVTDLVPSIDLNYKSHISLTKKQRELLLKERQNIIETSIYEIQINFFRIGKALAEIKQFRLYKADNLYKSWKEYIENRIKPRLHQSTISDYMGIVKMQLQNKDYIMEDDIIRLGYKKAKLLKSKLNLIEKIPDPVIKQNLENKFKEVYSRSFKELKDVPFSIYKYSFDFVQTQKPLGTNHHIIVEKVIDNFICKLDKSTNSITIKSAKNHRQKLQEIFQKIVDRELF